MHTQQKLGLDRYSVGRSVVAFCLLWFATGAGPAPARQPAPTAGITPASAQATSPRRVNIPYFAGDVDEGQSAIFWFGKNEFFTHVSNQDYQTPSLNYVDVRIAYSPAGLYWRANVIDYYLWYKVNAQASDVLTQTDAIALYLDPSHGKATSPQANDYYFLAGLHGDAAGNYRRQANGTGTGWNTNWSGTWTDYSGWQWSCNPGPNSNTCSYDYGWEGGGTIPWSTFGLSGPPADGTVWGMGVLNYDQDKQPSAYPLRLESWPETFVDGNNPSQWGEIHFGVPHYTPPPAVQRGTTTVRDTSQKDTTVQDAWMGGGGSCAGGQNGGSTINHGNDPDLFVGSENQATNFPCYNKSYLNFALSSVPPGKVIMSATLTVYQWGSAGDPSAPKDEDHGHDSYVWLSSVADPWNVGTITWNTAPLIQQNLSMTRVPTWPANTPIVWPGKPFTWDATQLVADAYAAGQPASMAIYDSATDRNTSKYMTGSQTGDWNVGGRPRLDIVWGDPQAQLTKQVSAPAVRHGTPVTYTLIFSGMGVTQTMMLTDTLPTGLSAPSALQSSLGTPVYNASLGLITWSGKPAAGQAVTLTYAETPTVTGPTALQNTAQLTSGSLSSTASATLIVDGYKVGLPAVLK